MFNLCFVALATAAGFNQNRIREVTLFRVAILLNYCLTDITLDDWENGGYDCWDWPPPKNLLWLPQHGSWGEVGGSGGKRRSWRRSREASTSCENTKMVTWKSLPHSHAPSLPLAPTHYKRLMSTFAVFLFTPLHTKRYILWLNFKGRINYFTKLRGMVGQQNHCGG